MSFKVDIRGYRNYADDLGRARARLKFCTAMFLSELAGKGRKAALEQLTRMTIRDRNFTKRRMGLDIARRSSPVAAQVARMGSVKWPRFTGWAEQEDGGEKPRVAMKGARVGRTAKGRLAGRYRLKPGNKFPTDRSTPITNAKSPEHRAFIFLRIMSRRAKAPFVLLDHPKFDPGVYTLDGKHGPGKWPRPRQLQAFGANVRVKRRPWMTDALAAIRKRANLVALWERCWKASHVLRKK